MEFLKHVLKLLSSARFGEALRSLQEQLDAKNFYAFNPSFDAPTKCEC
jgi:spore coat protein JC